MNIDNLEINVRKSTLVAAQLYNMASFPANGRPNQDVFQPKTIYKKRKIIRKNVCFGRVRDAKNKQNDRLTYICTIALKD